MEVRYITWGQSNGNTVKINVVRPLPTIPQRFGSFYFSFDGCKKVFFFNGCRPFIRVDECHLKTKYGCKLLTVAIKDPNDQYFPLAFGVVETRSKKSWRWFLQLLTEDIGQHKRYVFISDQQKMSCIMLICIECILCILCSLWRVCNTILFICGGSYCYFEEMFEFIEDKICLRHLYTNFKNRLDGVTTIMNLSIAQSIAQSCRLETIFQ